MIPNSPTVDGESLDMDLDPPNVPDSSSVLPLAWSDFLIADYSASREPMRRDTAREAAERTGSSWVALGEFWATH